MARAGDGMNERSPDMFQRRVLGALTALALAFAMASPAAAQGVIRDAEIEETMLIYAEPALRAAGLDPDDVSMYLIGDPTLNAFVSGGQNIFVHTGLILAAENPNQLIGVLAHETGHIAGGHLARSREAISQAMGPALIAIGLGVLAMAAGEPRAGAALIAGSQQIAMADFVRHTQVQESAADQAATTYLEATGQSGQGLIDFFNGHFRRYEFAVRRLPPYLLTHPFSSDRVEALRQRVAAGEHLGASDSAENLERFRFMQAKLVGFLQTQGQTLARYPSSDRSAPARYARAVAYYRVSDLARARAELESLIGESPDNPYYQELMGQILFENGRAAESVAYHRRSVELTDNEPLLLFNLARALIAADGPGNVDAAIALLTQVVEIEPLNSFAWSELAMARDLKGEDGLAELASAESHFTRGSFGAALNFAERAQGKLARNTPSFQRATDIATFAAAEMRDRAGQQGGQGGRRG